MSCADARLALSLRLDGELADEQGHVLRQHLAGCPACRAHAEALHIEQRTLSELWPAVAAPPGFAARVHAALPAARRPSRPWPLHAWPRAVAAAAVLAALAVGLFVTPVRAGLGEAFRTVLLRERETLAEPPRSIPIDVISVEEAQRRVPWTIRRPTALPAGYRLVGATAAELQSFADGPTVILYVQRTGAPAPTLAIMQLRPLAWPEEPVAPGAARAVSVAGRPALLIDGTWIERDGRQVWQKGWLRRLIVEHGDLLIQLEADPRDGWTEARLVAVAASMR